MKLDVAEGRIDIWAGHKEGLRWPCPECGTRLSVYDHAPEREWRHLDICQFKPFLHARVPGSSGGTTGLSKSGLSWAEEKARFTALFERLAIDVLRICYIKGATKILRISWDEPWHIMERAVSRGLKRQKKRLLKTIGVDEKSVSKEHDYLTLVSDMERAAVDYIGDDRKQGSMDGYFACFSEKKRAKV